MERSILESEAKGSEKSHESALLKQWDLNTSWSIPQRCHKGELMGAIASVTFGGTGATVGQQGSGEKGWTMKWEEAMTAWTPVDYTHLPFTSCNHEALQKQWLLPHPQLPNLLIMSLSSTPAQKHTEKGTMGNLLVTGAKLPHEA